MSFTYCQIPPSSMLPKSVRAAADRYNAAADALARHQFEAGVADSPEERQRAAEADAQALRDAIVAGVDLASVGQPHEAARRATVAGHEAATHIATCDALDAQVALAGVLAEHRQAVIEAATKSATAASEVYAQAVVALLDARRTANLALELLDWGHRIDGSRDVPRYGADPTPPLESQFDRISEDALRSMLTDDARRLERALLEEERRQHVAAENARADAANRAAAEAHTASRAAWATANEG